MKAEEVRALGLRRGWSSEGLATDDTNEHGSSGVPGRRPGLQFRTDEQIVEIGRCARAGPSRSPAAAQKSHFDHLGAGDEVVEAAAVGAENKAVVGERERDSDERDRADERGEHGAEQKTFTKPGLVSS